VARIVDDYRGGDYEYPAVAIKLHRASDYLSRSRHPEKGALTVSFELDTNSPLSSPPTRYELRVYHLHRFHPLSLSESSVRNMAMCLDYNANNVLELYDAGSLPKALVRRINDHIARCSSNCNLRCRFRSRHR
jgi:hypothetical protein